MVQCQMTPLKVWLHEALGCNHQSFACRSYSLHVQLLRYQNLRPWSQEWKLRSALRQLSSLVIYSVLTLLSVHHRLSLKTAVELLVICGRVSNFSVYLTVSFQIIWVLLTSTAFVLCHLAFWPDKTFTVASDVCIGNQTSIEILAVRYRTSSPFIFKNVHLCWNATANSILRHIRSPSKYYYYYYYYAVSFTCNVSTKNNK